jgi:hypothetical protein
MADKDILDVQCVEVTVYYSRKWNSITNVLPRKFTISVQLPAGVAMDHDPNVFLTIQLSHIVFYFKIIYF